MIGALARDIILSLHGEKARRATRDLDVAIAVSNWDSYQKVEEEIQKIEGFKKDTREKQRFLYRDTFIVDIVPFGDIMKEDDKIYWPPDDTIAMTALGFPEAQKTANKVTIDGDLTIDVASLAGIFILKLFAWSDRHLSSNKDADDMAFIISNYLNIHEERAANDHHTAIYLDDDFSTNTAGAKLLGIDIAVTLEDNASTKKKLSRLLEVEVKSGENSRLINQILETHSSFSYEEVMKCLDYLLKGLYEN
ncbi:hypothetical protein ES705_25913 [subsurface metagenome]